MGPPPPLWPWYPSFEVRTLKRKMEEGVNAQVITSCNHMGTHLDAPMHFVNQGKDIESIPLEWLYGPGVIVDVSDVGEYGIYTPEMIEKRVDLHDGDILFLHTGWHKYAWYQPQGDEDKYMLRLPGATGEIVPWLLKRKIHLWGVDAAGVDHPMNLGIGRPDWGLKCAVRTRAACEKKFGKENLAKLFPEEDYQITHNALFPHDCIHVEGLGGEIGNPKLLNKRMTLGCFPWKFRGGEAAFCRCVAFVDE